MPTLRPVEFEILLTLALGERHGYAIIQEIHARSGGAEPIETGTLYRALQRLTEADLVRPVAARRGSDGDDARRQYYGITAAGRRAATDAAQRMATLVMIARTARLLPEGSR